MIQRHKHLLYFVGLLIVMNILGPAIILGFRNFITLTNNQVYMMWLLSIPIFYIVAIFLTVNRFDIKLKIKWKPIKRSIIFYALLLILFANIFITVLDKSFFDSLINHKLRFLKFSIPLQGGVFKITYLILSILIGPLLEEILFRRIIFRKLLERYNLSMSLVLTSFLFAAMHQSPEGLLAYFFIGFIFTYLYHLTKVLWLNVLVHSIYNLLVSVTVIETYDSTDSFYFMGFVIYSFCAIGIFVILKKLKVLTK